MSSKLAFKEIVKACCVLEGKESQIKYGDMREAIGYLSMLMAKDSRVVKTLIRNGKRRWVRKK